MVTDYFEDFSLLERQDAPDGMGGQQTTWRYVTGFRGGLTHEAGQMTGVGGRPALCTRPTLLHEYDVTLQPGDCVRRERDGSLWRVNGCSGDMRAPAHAGLLFAQVQVERLVIPC